MTTLPSELSKVDPADAWKPWQPGSPAPWDRKWAAHLFRRATFGATPAEMERAMADGFEKTLARLLAGEPDTAERTDLLTETGQYYSDPANLRAWWLYAMLESGHPLREKLGLFWHNHFATSYAKVRSTKLMFDQNQTIRKHALGKFRPFLLDMSKDTAMLVWLDSNRNVKGAPNENYSREVMELFSLGVGNYTEKDIQEAARAFTGWHHDPEVTAFEFVADLHDDGPKTVFGKTGNFGGPDIVRLCADQPACARFLVGKLYHYLVSETPPPKGLLGPLDERFRKTDYDIADLVKSMLGSQLFFSDHAYRKRVKWPVEYALGAVRAAVPDRVPLGDVAEPLSKMGQVLFAPPNVKGWRCGTDWLNSATLLARNNFAETVAMGTWNRETNRGPRGATFAVAPPTAVADVAEPLPGIPATLIEHVPAASAAAAGAAIGFGLPTTMGPGGKSYFVVPLGEGGPGGPGGLPPGAGEGGIGAAPVPVPGQPVPKDPPGSPSPAPPAPDSKHDVCTVLFTPPPETVQALVARMGDVLFGQPLPPAARAKIEKFLLDGKPTLSPKDLESGEFKAKAREAAHAVMCLPEYQLN